MFFKKQKTSIGLDIGSSLIKMVMMKRTSKGYEMIKQGIKSLLPEAIVDGEIMDRDLVIDTIRELFDELDVKGKNVNASISGRYVIVKRISMEKQKEEEARESLKWEAEQHVHFDIDDVFLDLQILNDDIGDGQMDVLLVAAKKNNVLNLIDIIRDADLNPEIIDVDYLAIMNAFEINYQVSPDELIALVNIGADKADVSIIKDGIPHFNRDLPIAGNKYIEELQRNLNISDTEAVDLLKGTNQDSVDPGEFMSVIESVTDELSVQIDRSISYISALGESSGINRMVISGGSATIPNLTTFLNQRHGIQVEIVNTLKNVSYDPSIFGSQDPNVVSPILMVATGLSLRRPE
ncbi:MAG: hypothetical protein B6244_02555 [Candidatus Cloacimonetes bacterium 4572_55]|nr:MAG: hypothetical protein B6244_02555 [Candidatus Cloacimonetes bacterium 4572_55]